MFVFFLENKCRLGHPQHCQPCSLSHQVLFSRATFLDGLIRYPFLWLVHDVSPPQIAVVLCRKQVLLFVLCLRQVYDLLYLLVSQTCNWDTATKAGNDHEKKSVRPSLLSLHSFRMLVKHKNDACLKCTAPCLKEFRSCGGSQGRVYRTMVVCRLWTPSLMASPWGKTTFRILGPSIQSPLMKCSGARNLQAPPHQIRCLCDCLMPVKIQGSAAWLMDGTAWRMSISAGHPFSIWIVRQV